MKGKKWNEINETTREELMKTARAVDGRSGDKSKGGKCIIDFEGTDYSIAGELVIKDEEIEIIIDDNAIIYISFED